MISRDERIGYTLALKRKADDEGISVDEYLESDDYVIVEKNTDLAVHWDGDKYDFVVYGDKSEAVADAEVGDRVMKMTKWLSMINVA